MVREPFNLVLDDVRDIAPGVKHFAFEREDGKLLEFIPGQFVQILFETDESPVRRSYSIASRPGVDRTIDMAVSEVVDGFATERFWALKPGDKLRAMGPFGRLVLRDEPGTRYVLVATGTGVTPYRAMLPEIARRLAQEGTPDISLMFGVRRRDDLLYGDEFAAFAEEHPKFHFTAHYSRGLPADPRPYEREGYVQHAFESLGLNHDTDVVYLCGNPNMIDEALLWLTGRGFTAQRVRREKYISGA